MNALATSAKLKGMYRKHWEQAHQGWIVQRMWEGAWQFYAGTNEALGAVRWSSTASDAHIFQEEAQAVTLASRYQGFVRKGAR